MEGFVISRAHLNYGSGLNVIESFDVPTRILCLLSVLSFMTVLLLEGVAFKDVFTMLGCMLAQLSIDIPSTSPRSRHYVVLMILFSFYICGLLKGKMLAALPTPTRTG